MEDTDQETNSTSETKEAETASEGDETVVEEKKIIGQ